MKVELFSFWVFVYIKGENQFFSPLNSTCFTNLCIHWISILVCPPIGLWTHRLNFDKSQKFYSKDFQQKSCTALNGTQNSCNSFDSRLSFSLFSWWRIVCHARRIRAAFGSAWLEREAWPYQHLLPPPPDCKEEEEKPIDNQADLALCYAFGNHIQMICEHNVICTAL